MDKKTFNHNGLTFTYYQTGAGETDVFLQHGYSDNALCWGNLPRDLAKEYRVTSFDARGHGLSAKPKDGYNIDTMSGDILALMDHLGMDKPFFIGHSMGGNLGASVAAIAPDRMRGAILIDPAFRYSSNEERAELVEKRRSEVRELQKKSQSDIEAMIREKHPDWPEEVIAPAAQGKLQMSLDMIEIIRVVNLTWVSDLEQSTCPILVVTSDVDKEAIISKELAAEIDSKYNNVSISYISGAGHGIQRERYAETLTAIQAFFKQH